VPRCSDPTHAGLIIQSPISSSVSHDKTYVHRRRTIDLIAQEIGAEVIRGPVRYPSESGGIEVGGVDLGDYFYELKDQEVMLVIAPIGPVQELPIICGLYRTPYEGDGCPTCRQEREDAKRVIEERLRAHRDEKDRLVRDVEKWLGGEG
jgi:hypothetical protein